MSISNYSYFKVFAFSIVLIIGWLLLMAGFKNKKDKLWEDLDVILQKEYITLDRSADSLQVLYNEFHKTNVRASQALKKLMSPFLPTMEFRKFKTYFKLVKEDRFICFSSVSGSGTTTLASSLSKFIASSKNHLLSINCAPGFGLEYHKKYIGQYIEGIFIEGELLKFLKKSQATPDSNFVMLINNFGKINPETFFGAELWEKLGNPSLDLKIGGDTIAFPKNFHLISVTHSGVGSKVELTDEHFKRIGSRHYISPNQVELILYLRKKIKNQKHLKQFVYFFIKTNEYIERNYSKGHRLGQWSRIRNSYQGSDLSKALNVFTSHINSFNPRKNLTKKDLSSIYYTIESDGYLSGSNFINTQYKKLKKAGILTEFMVALIFILFSTISSWYLFRKRKNHIRSYTKMVYQVMDDFDANRINYDEASENINQIKRSIDNLILKSKIKYSEAAFFYTFIDSKVLEIENIKNINLNFKELINTFLDDGILTKDEYNKLNLFLEKIRHKIPAKNHEQFKQEIDLANKNFGS